MLQRHLGSNPDRGESAPLAGQVCEHCLDAPALILQPAPWGGERGVCTVCATP